MAGKGNRFYSPRGMTPLERAKLENTAASMSETSAVTSIAFVTLAENGQIDEVTATEHAETFAAWEPDVAYVLGNIRRDADNLYKCVQAHTSQSGWEPHLTPALWAKIGDPAEEWPEWSQPIGAQDAYIKGDKVSYNGGHWISDVDNNVWQPGVYGWHQEA